MKISPEKFKRAVCGLLCAAFIVLPGCGTRSGGSSQDPPASQTPQTSPSSQNGDPDAQPAVSPSYTKVTLTDSGELETTRAEFPEIPMGDGGTWTFFVYMSGSTLESSIGKGTEDMEEMLAGAAGENVRFIVQTGGSTEWKNDDTPADKLCRFEISGGRRTKLAELPLASMADRDTLTDFLEWGVESYPAEKMGVIFWGHGTGSIGGVCKDNLHHQERLSLQSINSAFAEVTENMTDKFELVGFDACYMGTLEAADILASYARYMIGSEELEAVNGWNYERLGALLSGDPNADRTEISKAICDGFFDDSDDQADRATIAVIDLSGIDDILKKFNALSKEFYESAGKSALEAFEARLDLADHFGDGDFTTGYSNTADLADLVRCMGTPGADKLLETINGAVVYKRNGKAHPNACGLTVIYPFKPDGIEELRKFAALSVCPYYMAVIDKKLRAASPVYDPDGSEPSELTRLWCEGVNGGNDAAAGYWGAESGSVKADELTLGLDGSCRVRLAEDTLGTVASVELRLFRQLDEKGNRFMALGGLPLEGDGTTGGYSGRFCGKWLLYPDGTPLGIIRRGIDPEICGSLIRYGDKETELRLSLNTAVQPPEAEIVGIRRQDSGSGSIEQPDVGSVIQIMYQQTGALGDPYGSTEQSAYAFSGSDKPVYDTLPDDGYFCMIVITDIFNDTLRSDRVRFTLVNGEMTGAEIVQ